MSVALTISGNTNILEASYSPAIELNGDYEIGLVLIETFNSIPNITSENNCFYFGADQVIVVPEGSYELSHIYAYLKSKIFDNKPEGEFPFISLVIQILNDRRFIVLTISIFHRRKKIILAQSWDFQNS